MDLSTWHTQQENILKQWGEQAACLKLMHYNAYVKYKQSNLGFALPCIIISTIAGTANFAQDTFSESMQAYVPAIIGSFNLITAILTTIAQFLKISELLESHRVAYIQYGKLARNITLELTLPIHERSHKGTEMIEVCRAEYDRLLEQSPPIPNNVLKSSEKILGDENITVPDIAKVVPIVPFDSTKSASLIEKVAGKFGGMAKRKDSEGEKIMQELKSMLAQTRKEGDIEIIQSS